MPTKTLRFLLAALCCAWLSQTTGLCASYFYSGQVSGYVDAELTPGGMGQGGIHVVFGTLTETLIYDPVAGTLQEIGSVTISPSSGTFDIIHYYPFPSKGVVGSATLNIGENNTISFDRTLVLNNNHGGGALKVPVSGSGVYNGEAFSGSWDLEVPIYTYILEVTSTSLTFSEQGRYAQYRKYVIPGTDLATANNDGTYYVNWQLDSAVAQVIVPDGGATFVLLGVAFIGLAALRRRFVA